ncbi:MAG: hypothetical protein JW750_05790 [Anaerolineaceae bacterium]|nr:hypothetical protein [Anaerolineaceae bacterium]
MNQTIRTLLDGKGENHILPFFWQHGEDEATLRKYMQVIQDAGIGAVCVESRPHPDFCGPKWWQDMDIILDEARNRDMKVWILDDSHFPTGYANGAVETAPEELARQFILHSSMDINGGRQLRLNLSKFLRRPREKKSLIGMLLSLRKKKRVYSGDVLLGVTAVRIDQPETIDLTGNVVGKQLVWDAPEGQWKICLTKLSRNCGMNRNYINMADRASCQLMIDAVYDPHYEHYADDFGKTIAGFFSDEPQLGNGQFLNWGNVLGTDQALPWSREIPVRLVESLGSGWLNQLCHLWVNDLDSNQAARVRYAYMDALTRCVEEDFSFLLGDWCRAHGVEYIGHVIEDYNQHGRTGDALGHFYRGLAGQDMAGIDDIGGQVFPQGEDGPTKSMRILPRDGEFFHYALGKLGSSHASIDPLKKGRAMCEIYGAYGWSEGLRLEKYLTDHFLVRGINYYVPHAFSPKAFPDPDCPPHFYAHGHNPQYRAFGHLMRYMNRVCELISNGQIVTPVAVLYHAEAEWTGKCMLMQKPARVLVDRQIDFEFVPTDVFTEIERFHTDLTDGLSVNGKSYQALVIPTAEYISADFALAAGKLHKDGFPVFFIDALPKGIYTGDGSAIGAIKDIPVVSLDQLAAVLDEAKVPEISISPASNRLRYLHYQTGTDLFMFVNEAAETYHGDITVPVSGSVYAYNAWDNRLETVNATPVGDGTKFSIALEPFQSLIVIFDEVDQSQLVDPLQSNGQEIKLPSTWRRSTCSSLEYPQFSEQNEITLPDQLAEEKPKFSGFVRYENTVSLDQIPASAVLEITDAWEGVEVFINGTCAGTQIVPTYRFEIANLLKQGENTITIEVATTLERERAAARNRSMMERMQIPKEKAPTGITGIVRLFTK